ncbi:hypothetical protein YC2023_078606 [Brassica napus]
MVEFIGLLKVTVKKGTNLVDLKSYRHVLLIVQKLETTVVNRQLGKWLKSHDNLLIDDSIINIVDGKLKQDQASELSRVFLMDLINLSIVYEQPLNWKITNQGAKESLES